MGLDHVTITIVTIPATGPAGWYCNYLLQDQLAGIVTTCYRTGWLVLYLPAKGLAGWYCNYLLLDQLAGIVTPCYRTSWLVL